MYSSYVRGEREFERNRMVRGHYYKSIWLKLCQSMQRLAFATENASAAELFDFACMITVPDDDRDWDLSSESSDSDCGLFPDCSSNDENSLDFDNFIVYDDNEDDDVEDESSMMADTDVEMTDVTDGPASSGSGHQWESSQTPREITTEKRAPAGHHVFVFVHPGGSSEGGEDKGTTEHVEDVEMTSASSATESDEDQVTTEHVENVGASDSDDDTIEGDWEDYLDPDSMEDRRWGLTSKVIDATVYYQATREIPHLNPTEINSVYLYWAWLAASECGKFYDGLATQALVAEAKTRHKGREAERRIRHVLAEKFANDSLEVMEDSMFMFTRAAALRRARRFARRETFVSNEEKKAYEAKREQFQIARTSLLASGRKLTARFLAHPREVNMAEQHKARMAKGGIFPGAAQFTRKELHKSPLYKSQSVEDESEF